MELLYSETLYKIYDQSANFFIFLIFALAIFAILSFKYFKFEYTWLFCLILGIGIFEFLFGYFRFKGVFDIRFLNHSYSLFALILASIFYSKILRKPKIKLFNLIICILFIVIDIYQIYTTKGLLGNPIALPLMNISIVYMSLFLYSKMLKSPTIKSISNEPLFWFNLGFFIINIFQLVLVPLFNQMILVSDNLAFVVGTIKNLADPITYTLWAIGIYKLRTQPFRPIASLWP